MVWSHTHLTWKSSFKTNQLYKYAKTHLNVIQIKILKVINIEFVDILTGNFFSQFRLLNMFFINWLVHSSNRRLVDWAKRLERRGGGSSLFYHFVRVH